MHGNETSKNNVFVLFLCNHATSTNHTFDFADVTISKCWEFHVYAQCLPPKKLNKPWWDAEATAVRMRVLESA